MKKADPSSRLVAVGEVGLDRWIVRQAPESEQAEQEALQLGLFLRFIAEIKRLPEQRVVEAVAENTARLYRLGS